jgi:hypothetical protein
MKPSERQGFRKKLESDIETVETDVTRLFSQRRVFQGLAQVFRDNPALNARWTELHTFMFGGYVAQACLRLRRLMDAAGPKQTLSLANIVSRLCQHPELFTRAEYVERFTNGHDLPRVRELLEADANEKFDQFADPGGSCLNPSRLRDLFLRAESNCAKVLTYVDKRLAHYDRARPEDPRWGELDEAIDAVGDLYIRVQLLLTCIVDERKDLAGTWQGAAWEPLLEVPWRTPPQAEEDLLPSN